MNERLLENEWKTDWKLPEHIVTVELLIYGCDSQEEADEEVKRLVENGLWVQGISGTTVIRVVTKQRGGAE